MSVPERMQWHAELRQLEEDRDFDGMVEAIERSPYVGSSEARLELAKVAMERVELEDALAQLETLIADEPAYEPAVAWQIAALDRLARFALAREVAHEGLARFPAGIEVRVAAAHFYLGRHDKERALEIIDDALSLEPDNAKALRSRIEILRDLYRWTDAEDSALELLRAHPDNSRSAFELGMVYFDQGRYEEARAAFNESLAKDPANVRALEWRVTALRMQARWAQAEVECREGIGLRPRRPELYCELGWVLHSLDRSTEALEAFTHALEIHPGHGWALRSRVSFLRDLRQWDAAEQAARALLHTHPHDPRSEVFLGWVYSDQDRVDEAQCAFERSLKIDDRYVWAYTSRLYILRTQRRWRAAEDAARTAIDLLPQEPALYHNLGWILDGQGRQTEALDCFEKALAIDNTYLDALVSRVTILRAMNEWVKAEAAARDALEKHPKAPDLYTGLGWALHGQGQTDEAVACFEQALNLDPGNVWTLSARSSVLREAYRWAEAETAAREAVDRRPRSAKLNVELGWTLVGQYRMAEALTCFAQALQLEDVHSWALRSTIRVLQEQRAWTEAEEVAETLMRAKPLDILTWISYSELLTGQGRGDEALVAIERALEIDGGDRVTLSKHISVLRSLSRWEEAEAAAKEAITKYPFAAELLDEFARVLHAQGRGKEALNWFDLALSKEPRFSWALHGRVMTLRTECRWAEAEAAARDLIQNFPFEPWLALELGVVLSDQERYNEALVAFEQSLAIAPSYEGAHMWKINSLKALQDWDAAEAAADMAIARFPRSPGIYIELGYVLNSQGRTHEALAAFEQALGFDNRYERAIRGCVSVLRILRRWEEAQAKAEALIQQHPHDAWSYIILGWVYCDQDRCEEGLTAFEKALAIDHTEATALEWRIVALRRLERWSKAELVARDAQRSRPSDPRFFVQLSRINEDQERYETALNFAEQALRLDATDWASQSQYVDLLRKLLRFADAEKAARGYVAERHFLSSRRLLLAGLLDAQHRHTEALAEYERALMQNPMDVDVMISMSSTLRSLRCFEEAEAVLNNAASRFPHLTTVRFELGFVCLERGDHDGASRIFEELVTQATGPKEAAQAQYGLGWVAMRCERYSDAVRHFDRGAQLRPGEPDAAIGLAWAKFRLGGAREYDEAERLCREVLRDHPHAHLAHSCLGMICYRRSSFAAAERHFRRCIELAPYDGCYVDLGALYLQLGRYEEAEGPLCKALELNSWDTQARVNLGSLYLQRYEMRNKSDETAQDAASACAEFRQALSADPLSGRAALGLAVALLRAPGNYSAAESVLRTAIKRHVKDTPTWTLHLALARILIQSGDDTKQSECYESAVREATLAISMAANQAEPYFVAGLAEQRLSEAGSDLRGRALHRRRAYQHFKTCARLDGDYAEVSHAVRLIEEQTTVARANALRGAGVAGVAIAILAAMWVDFEWKHHVTTVMITTLTPVLVGLIAIGFLMPLLVRLKLPGGTEADLSANVELLSPGPTGRIDLSSLRFPAIANPTGELAPALRFATRSDR